MDRNPEFPLPTCGDLDRVFNFCKKKRSVRRNDDDDSLASELDNLQQEPTTIRLFGVNITVNQSNDNGNKPSSSAATTSHDESAVTTIDQKKMRESPSRMRKWTRHNQQEEVLPAPLFHQRILQEMQQHPILLFKKNIENSDVSRARNRLLIIRSHVDGLMAALTEEERKKVEISQDKNADYLSVVTTTVADGVEYEMHLKKWAGSGTIVLKHEWGRLVDANGLEKGDSVQGWGYRAQDIIKK